MTDASPTVSLDWLKAVRGGHQLQEVLTSELEELLSVDPAEAKEKVSNLKILNQQMQNKFYKNMMMIYWCCVILRK